MEPLNTERMVSLGNEREVIIPIMSEPSSDQPHWLLQAFKKANTIRGDVLKPSEGYFVYMFGLDLADGEDQTAWHTPPCKSE